MTYSTIIPLLQNELDWKSICFQVAAKHPEVFHEAYLVSCPDNVRNAVIDVLNGAASNKIKAMKAYRELTKHDLLKSKEYVEAIIAEFKLS